MALNKFRVLPEIKHSVEYLATPDVPMSYADFGEENLAAYQPFKTYSDPGAE